MIENFKIKTGFNSKMRIRFANIKNGAKQRNLFFDLTEQQMCDLLNGTCSYCGCKHCNGIDRVDSSKGYTIDNVVPCCAICNRMKNNYPLEMFVNHINKIYKYLNNDN